MDMGTVFGIDIYIWIILPLFIFLARVADVTLGTMRIVFISKGLRYLAPLVGFFEVFIWIVAIKELMQNLTNVLGYVAYAGGFAVGNYIGLKLESRLAIGSALVRVITQRDTGLLIRALKERNCGVTSMKAEGSQGPVNIVFMIVRRIDLQEIMGLIQRFNPRAFYTIEEIKAVREGIFPARRIPFAPIGGPFRFFRKGK